MSAECTRDPLSTFLSHASISNACVHMIIAHSVLLSFHQLHDKLLPPLLLPDVNVQQVGVAVAADAASSTVINVVVFKETPNSVATVSGVVSSPAPARVSIAARIVQSDSMMRCPRGTTPRPRRMLLTALSRCTGLGVPSHTQWDPWGHPHR